MYDYEKIGLYCKKFRVNCLKMTQSEVANELNLTVSSISMFENGNSKSFDILIFYLIKGLPVNLLRDMLEE